MLRIFFTFHRSLDYNTNKLEDLIVFTGEVVQSIFSSMKEWSTKVDAEMKKCYTKAMKSREDLEESRNGELNLLQKCFVVSDIEFDVE